MKLSGRSPLQPDQIQGFVFDGATFLANFFWLDALFGTPVDDYDDRTIAALLAAGVLTQLLGVMLKKGPLQERLGERKEERSPQADDFLGCLSFVHFIFFLLVVAMTLALAGFIDLNEASGLRELVWVAISAVVAAATSGLAWLALSPASERERPQVSWAYQELLGNVLLWISASILTRFFWDALLLETEPPTYMGFAPRAFLLVGASSALFMVFYVPARLLFLAEDYKYPATWIRLWLVAMIPLMTVVFLPHG